MDSTLVLPNGLQRSLELDVRGDFSVDGDCLSFRVNGAVYFRYHRVAGSLPRKISDWTTVTEDPARIGRATHIGPVPPAARLYAPNIE